MLRKYLKFVLFIFAACLIGAGIFYFFDIWKGNEIQTQTAQPLKLLNSHSQPQVGDKWVVSFETTGNADLTITPEDSDTIGDLDFISLTCDGKEKKEAGSLQILEGDAIFYPNWQCDGTGELIHLVNIARKHTLKFQFEDKMAFAYNNPDSVTDTFDDESKIATSTNITVSGGQVYSGICKDNGTACSGAGECCSNYCVDGVCCDGICSGSTCQTCGQYSSNGIGYCGYVNDSGQDPDNECDQGSTADDGCRSNNCSGLDYTCGVQSSSDGGCPVCGRCTDPDISCEYHPANTYDSGCSQCNGCSGSEIGACTLSQTTVCNAGTYGCSGTYYKCYNGSCVNGTSGASCSADNGCCAANPYCYVDADNDRYAPSSGTKTCRVNSQLAGTDCYDANANAYPNQTSYFTTSRGDGSFDYNCDGASTTESATCSSNRTCTTSGTQYSCYTSSGGGLCLTFLRYAYSGCTDGGYATASCGETWNRQYCYASTCLIQDCTDQAGTQYYCRTSSNYVCACR